jgi:hypothetical protein
LCGILGEQVAELAHALCLAAFVARGENAAVARHDGSRGVFDVARDAPLFFALCGGGGLLVRCFFYSPSLVVF